MKKYFKHIIKKLYYKYCFDESQLAMELINYYIPNTMRKLDGTKIDGQFLFAQLNEKFKNNTFDYNNDNYFVPFLDVNINSDGVKA